MARNTVRKKLQQAQSELWGALTRLTAKTSFTARDSKEVDGAVRRSRAAVSEARKRLRSR